MAEFVLRIPDRFRSALTHLLTVYDYAPDNEAERWQLAIELPDLLSTGATLSDVRWLVLRGFAAHAKETTIPGDEKRSFRLLTLTCIPIDTCLVLSTDGATALRSALGLRPADSEGQESARPDTIGDDPPCRLPQRVIPEWDAVRRELRHAGQVIKRYRVPAPNQALILTAFQELNWPVFIDDPLPPVRDQDPKHRLQATIKSLNRNQSKTLIRFHGNGNGLQVYWEVVADA